MLELHQSAATPHWLSLDRGILGTWMSQNVYRDQRLACYDSFKNRKMIFNSGMTPNIKENPRHRKTTKRGRKKVFSEAIYQERLDTVERAFAWEDKFKRLLIRFEFKSINHLGLKLLAFTLINLRHFV